MKFNWHVVLFCALFLGTVAGDAFAQADEDELVILLLVDALRPDHISGLAMISRRPQSWMRDCQQHVSLSVPM